MRLLRTHAEVHSWILCSKRSPERLTEDRWTEKWTERQRQNEKRQKKEWKGKETVEGTRAGKDDSAI